MRYPIWFLRWQAMRLNKRREALLKRARELDQPMPNLTVPLMPDRKQPWQTH